MKSLNPCPLCGNKDIDVYRTYTGTYADGIGLGYFAGCNEECEILTIGETEEEAIAKWNNLKVKEQK